MFLHKLDGVPGNISNYVMFMKRSIIAVYFSLYVDLDDIQIFVSNFGLLINSSSFVALHDLTIHHVMFIIIHFHIRLFVILSSVYRCRFWSEEIFSIMVCIGIAFYSQRVGIWIDLLFCQCPNWDVLI